MGNPAVVAVVPVAIYITAAAKVVVLVIRIICISIVPRKNSDDLDVGNTKSSRADKHRQDK